MRITIKAEYVNEDANGVHLDIPGISPAELRGFTPRIFEPETGRERGLTERESLTLDAALGQFNRNLLADALAEFIVP